MTSSAPTDFDPATILRGAVACAVQAPSSHNTQPWRFHRRGSALEVRADLDRHLTVIDPEHRQLVMSCGCALYNARVAVRAAGFLDTVTPCPDPDRPELLAVLRIGLPRAATDHDRELLAAIPRRHTNRRPFVDRPISASLAEPLIRAAAAERTRMIRLDPDQKTALAGLVAKADRLQFDDPEFRAELRRWLAPAGSPRKDGIPFAEKEYGSSLPFALTVRLRTIDLGDRFGEIERTLVSASPLVAVFATEADDVVDWLDCGQALESVLLRATSLGLSAAFFNQCLEVPVLAERVRALIGTELTPQTIIRLGWAAPVEHPAPRRDLDDVLTEED